MPEPVLISIAAALAGRAVIGLYTLVKDKFSSDPEASSVLDAAEGAAEHSSEVRELANMLKNKESADPTFAEQLRNEWARANVDQHAESGGVTNQISGQVGGNVVQARDIQGGIQF